MLTESTLAELRTLITTTAPADRQAQLAAALDDLQRTIAAQALVIRNLSMDLRNRRIGQEALDALVPAGSMDALLAPIGQARATPFSLDDAQKACAALANATSHATDFAEIAAAVVKVARVFL